jgi:hypothetical protein
MGQEFAQGSEWDHAAGPQWWLLDDDWPAAADHRGVQRLVTELNRIYQDCPALWQLDSDPAGFRWLDPDAAQDNVYSFVRRDAAGRSLVAVSNLSPTVRTEYRIGLPGPGRWHVVLDTDEQRFGGGGAGQAAYTAEEVPWQGQEFSAALTLPPLATVWLCPQGPDLPLAPARSSRELDLAVADPAAAVAAVQRSLGDSAARTDHLDGLTVRFSNGSWFNLRASDTEPVLRLSAEAGDRATLDALCERVLAALPGR